jgi:hypothetical protein
MKIPILTTHCCRLTARSSLLAALSFLFLAFTAFGQLNYDTAWTYVYDGGKLPDSTAIYDELYDIKVLPDGGYVCVGSSVDSLERGVVLLMKLDVTGNMVWKKLHRGLTGSQYYGHSVIIANNTDFIIGGKRGAAPWIFRTDTLGNIKWATWYYDSTRDQLLLSRGGGGQLSP